MIESHRLVGSAMVLGEGPVRLDGSTYACVDIRRGSVHTGDLDGGFDTRATFDTTVSAVFPCEDGSLVAAVGTTLVLLDGHQSVEIAVAHPTVRLNDGKPDPTGRIVVGSMADPPVPGAGSLFSVENGEARPLVDDLTISNGLCWSSDGETMFHVDTPTGTIRAFDYDLATGDVSGGRSVVEIGHDVGMPDGLTIDADGGLWVALWGGSAVHRYDGARLSEVVEVPTPHVTCPVFAGPAGDVLVVTTASEPNPGERGAGDVYVCRPGVVGARSSRARIDTVFGSHRSPSTVEESTPARDVDR